MLYSQQVQTKKKSVQLKTLMLWLNLGTLQYALTVCFQYFDQFNKTKSNSNFTYQLGEMRLISLEKQK